MNDIKSLKSEISLLEREVERLAALELAIKIVLNGGYGATGSAAFRYYDEAISEGITATGQVAIIYVTNKINEFINREVGTEGIDHVVISDTDSTTGDTVLTTSLGKISIADLYNRYTDESTELKQNSKDSVRRLIEPVKSASFDGNEVVYNNINYIMKHRVKKRMYRIKCGDNSVDITEDHSVIVYRNGNTISIKPKDIDRTTDTIIRIVEDQT